jgi:hypothetical protein
MKGMGKRLGQAAVIFAAWGAFGAAYCSYQSHKMESFCKGIPATGSPDLVTALAKTKGFPVVNALDSSSEIVVVNHEASEFKFACTATFKDGHLIGTSTRAVD